MSQLMPSRVIGKTFSTTDPWQCATENYPKYFQVPKPTGDLDKALVSYGSELLKSCTLTGIDRTACPFPEKTRWCAFATAAPYAVLTAYSSYGSEASSFWSAQSSKVVSLARECPERWYRALYMNLNNPIWLNNTIAHAECYAEAHATPRAPKTEASTTRATARPAVSEGWSGGNEYV
jgi:hypothetical protein